MMTPFRVRWLPLLATCVAILHCQASLARADGIDQVAAQYSLNRLDFEYWVNGVKLRDAAAGPGSGSAILNPWLKRGKNHVKLVAKKGPTNDKDLRYRLSFEIVKLSAGATTETSVFQVKNPPKLPYTKEFDFELPSFPVLAVWSAPVIKLDAAAKQAVLKDLAGLAAELNRKDPAAIQRHGELAQQQADIATGRTINAQEQAKMRTELTRLLQITPSVPGPTEKDLVFESMAGGRLIRVSRKDKKPIVAVGMPERPSVSIPAFFYARVDGTLKVIGQ